MKIVAITSCSTGIAHTYMAAEKLQMEAEAMGHQIKVETQGSIGAENVLTAEDIREADAVLIAANTGGQAAVLHQRGGWNSEAEGNH